MTLTHPKPQPPTVATMHTNLDAIALDQKTNDIWEAHLASTVTSVLSRRHPRDLADVAARAGLTEEVTRSTLDKLMADGLAAEAERGFRAVEA